MDRSIWRITRTCSVVRTKNMHGASLQKQRTHTNLAPFREGPGSWSKGYAIAPNVAITSQSVRWPPPYSPRYFASG